MHNSELSAVSRSSESSKQQKYVVLLITLVSIAVFLPSLSASFVYDDRLLISENLYAHGLEHISRGFLTHFWDVSPTEGESAELHYYRPIVTLSYIVDWVISQGHPAYFHLVNVLLHAACSALVTRALIRWLGGYRLAGALGLFLALHPTRTESVIWISGRTDLFMVLFLFLALEFIRQAHLRVSYGLPVAAAASCFLLALLSKEPAVLFPLLIAIDWSCTRTTGKRPVYKRAFILSGAVGILYLAARFALLPVHESNQFPPSFQRGFVTLASYAERIVFPWPQTFFYRLMDGTTETFTYPLALVVVGAVITVSYALLALWSFWHDRTAFQLLAMAALLLAPLANFYQSGLPFTSCDRFLYLPFTLLSAALARLLSPHWSPRFHSSVGAWRYRKALYWSSGTLVSLGALALVYYRCLDYRSEKAHWLHEYSLNPENPSATEGLSKLAANRGDIPAAYAFAQRSVAGFHKYPMLETANARTERTMRRLELEAALLPDGALKRLAAIDQRLLEMSAKATELPPLLLGGLHATAAFVATRLGHAQRAQALLKTVQTNTLTRLPNPKNIVLTHARLRDFKLAHEFLAILAKAPTVDELETKELQELGARITRAEQALQHDSGPQGRAQAMAQLGAYRLALLALHPLITQSAYTREIAQQFSQLLIAARLEEAATQLIGKHTGRERALQIVAQLRGQLPPELSRLTPVPGPFVKDSP